jgi:hypothetical protein
MEVKLAGKKEETSTLEELIKGHDQPSVIWGTITVLCISWILLVS